MKIPPAMRTDLAEAADRMGLSASAAARLAISRFVTSEAKLRADLAALVDELRAHPGVPSGATEAIARTLGKLDVASDGDPSVAAVVDAIGRIATFAAPLAERLRKIVQLIESDHVPREFLNLPANSHGDAK